MKRPPALLTSLGGGGAKGESTGGGGSVVAPHPPGPLAEEAMMATPREEQEEGDGEEEEEYWEPPTLDDGGAFGPVGTLPLEDAEDAEEEDDGAGASLEAEVIRRRDLQLLGQTAELPAGQQQHRGSSMASMEEGSVGSSAAPADGSTTLAREPSVSLSLSVPAEVGGDPPLVAAAEPQQPQEEQERASASAAASGGGAGAAGGGGGGLGIAAALMRTLRLDGQESGGEGAKGPPSSEASSSSQKKKGSKGKASKGGGVVVPVFPHPEGQQPPQLRGRGSSSASSTSSTLSRRILGMDEPTAVAAALVAMSAFIYSLESVNVKLLGKDVGFWTISVWRGVVGLVCCAISYLAGRRTEHTHWLGHPELRRFLALRGAMGAAAVISSFAALTNMDLADATSLMSTAPLWTALMAVLMNKGTWSRYDSAAAVCCTVGVLLVLKPGPLFPRSASDATTAAAEGMGIDDGEITGAAAGGGMPRNNAFGVISAIVCAVTTAAFTVMTRYVMEENTSVVSGYAMVACIILALPGLVYEQITRRGQRLVHGLMYDLVQLMLTGLFSYAAHMAKTYAMQITRSLGVIVMRYLNILFAFVFESFLLHQRVDPLAVAGAAVIVAGCVASIFAQGARGQVVSSHQKQPSLSLSSSAALAAAVIKEAELAEAAGKPAAVRLPAA